jgi:cysteine desulfurase family protein
MIYLDQAATSFPKPSEVVEAVGRALRNVPGSPGRSAHRGALEASRIIFEARERLASFLGVSDSSRLVFTSGATEGLNLVLLGLLKPGDVVLATSMEHNSMARPLEYLKKERAVQVHYLPCNQEGFLDLSRFREMKRALRPRLICLNLVSNVTGTIQPLPEVVAEKGESLLLVDAAQAVGHLPFSTEGIDFLVFSGHKGLFGPAGTGVLYLAEGLEETLIPLKFGGTGSRSESLEMPEFLPDRFECGTPNLPGIAGLSAGIAFIEEVGLAKIRRHESALCEIFLERIKDHPKIKIYGPKDRLRATGIISLNVEGLPPSEVAHRLDVDFGIAVRSGLQCAPLAHRTLGTFPQGTVRFSFGYFNRLSEVEEAAQALLEIAS